MSDNKVIKSRILQRTDTEEKWNEINPVLSCSEIIFSKTPGGVFMKLGDGRKYSETPFYQDIKIDESQISSLKILHISQSDYSKLVVQDNILSNALYIISSDNMDMMGEQIKNLADATDLSDAINLHQMQDAISQVNEQFSGYVPTHRSINGIQLTGDLSVGTITGIKMNGTLKGSSGIVNLGTVLTAHQSLSNYVTKNELSTKSSVFIDNNQSDLNVIHIDNSEYSNLVATDSTDNSTIYIVSSDNMDMMGEQIKNLADGTDLSDAVNLGQVQNIVDSSINSKISNLVDETILNEKLDEKSSVSVDNIQSNLNVLHVSDDEYSNIVNSDSVDSNTIYIVSSDVFNAYGEQIKNVANATDLSDAVNLGQINELIQPLNQNISTKVSSLIMNGNELTSTNGRINLGSVISAHQSLSGYVIKNISSDFSVNLTGDFIFQSNSGQNVKFKNGYVEFNGADNGIEFNNGSYNAFHAGGGIVVEDINNYKVEKDGLYSGAKGIGHIISAEMLSTYAKNSDIDSKLSSVNTKSSVSVDNVQSNLNVIHIDDSEYSNLVATDSIDNSTIYIVSSDNLNMMGEKITNLSPATDISDAVNLGQMESFVDEKTISIKETIENLSSDISIKSSISVDNIKSNLNVLHIDSSEYQNLVANDSVDNSTIYIVSSDNFDAFGEQIKNVADATDLSDAVNLGQVEGIIGNSLLSIESNISTLNSNILTKTTTVVDGDISNLSVIHISNEEYGEIVANDNVQQNILYIVSSDNLNMTGEKIINLADGTDLSDAVNLGQMTTAIETVNTTVNSKSTVSVDGQVSDIQIVHIELSDYEQLVIDDNINPNYVYITQSDIHNVYGERITNVAEAIDENDAIPLKQVQRDYVSKTNLANALSQLNENNCTAGDILSALKSLI